MIKKIDYQSGIVTGAGNGIGLYTVSNLLDNKYKVYAITKSKSILLEELKKKYNNKLIIHYQDITNFNKTKKLINKICLLEKNLCFLINNAGQRKRGAFLNLKIEDFIEVMNSNFFSHVNITREFLKNTTNFKKNTYKIIFITSIVGPRGFNELSSYAASKSALEALTKSLTVEFAGTNIYFNSIAPGFVKTSYASNFKKNKQKLHKWTISKTPLRRWGEASEIAEIVNFLISNKSSYINGATLYADGGWSAE